MSDLLNNLKNKIDQRFLRFLNFFNNSIFIRYLLLILFTLLTYFLLRGHVLYRDDARPLLLVTYEKSIFQLFNAIRYDGGPILYHFILWIISKFIPLTPFVVKALHLFIQVLILFVLLFLIKIPSSFKLLILLQAPFIGYIMYVRKYTIAVLLILVFAYLYTKDKGEKIWIYIVLFLLSQTCPHGIFISISFFLFLVFNRFIEKRILLDKYYLIPLIGYLFCMLQLIPPKDLALEGLRGMKPFFTNATLDFFMIFLYHIFLNNFLIGSAFLLIIILLSLIAFQRKKVEVIGFLISLILIFTAYSLLGALKCPSQDRHNWLLSYTIISFLIIISHPVKETIIKTNIFQYALIILLLFSFYNFASLIPKAKRLSSHGQNVAYFIDKNFPEKRILAKYDFFIESILVYRNQLKPFYSLDRQQDVKYFRPNGKSSDFTKFKDLVTILKYSELVQDLSNTSDEIFEKEPVVVLASHEYVNDLNIPIEKVKIKEKYSLRFLKEFTGALYDNFILYSIKKS